MTSPTTDYEGEIRRIFEKHTMPESGDPELTLFDTDAVINDLVSLLNKAIVDEITRGRPKVKIGTFNKDGQPMNWAFDASHLKDNNIAGVTFTGNPADTLYAGYSIPELKRIAELTARLPDEEKR